LTHDFCSVDGDVKLHYLRSLPRSGVDSSTNLVIFIHGFPDSWMLWQHHLKNTKLAAKAVLVAVDLPGYGGSDSLPNYGPDQVLNVLSDFILRMREQYLHPDSEGNGRRGRVLIVAHDWGAVLAFRLAAETPQLADRFILSNGVHAPLAFANINTRLQAASHMLSSWKHAPGNLRLLGKAFANIKPVLKQIIKSGYVFAFNLPSPLSSAIGSLGDYWMLRFINAATVTGSHGAEILASSVGPGPNQCVVDQPPIQNIDPTPGPSDNKSTTSAPPLRYSDAVRRRALSGGSSEKLRLYRDGCLTRPWTKSLEVLWCLNQLENSDEELMRRRRSSGSTAGLFEVGPEGVLGAPMTVIWGREDVAIENCIAIEGLGDYFGVRNSQLVVIGRCGHWTPVERLGAPVFDAVLEWTLAGEKVPLKKWFGDDYPLVTVSIEK
jgi:pimeloyl-ACP methyl ester carboxylesterase